MRIEYWGLTFRRSQLRRDQNGSCWGMGPKLKFSEVGQPKTQIGCFGGSMLAFESGSIIIR